MIDINEVREWIGHSVTKKLMAQLRLEYEATAECAIHGSYLNDDCTVNKDYLIDLGRRQIIEALEEYINNSQLLLNDVNIDEEEIDDEMSNDRR